MSGKAYENIFSYFSVYILMPNFGLLTSSLETLLWNPKTVLKPNFEILTLVGNTHLKP